MHLSSAFSVDNRLQECLFGLGIGTHGRCLPSNQLWETLIIQTSHFKRGSIMRHISTSVVFAILVLIISGTGNQSTVFGQPAVQGPRAGSVPSGVAVSTNSFSEASLASSGGGGLKSFEINEEIEKLPTPANVVRPLGPEGSNYFEDHSASLSKVAAGTARPVAMKSFEGIPQTNYIPPDPIIAVGPNNVIVAVNASFRIFDKSGAILKTINSGTWFSAVVPSASPSDPIVMYDHFANRWIFASINVDTKSKKSYILLSTSANDNPIGTWHSWALPSDVVGDSAVNNWSDYERVGFDSAAIYITGNQFDYTSGRFKYSKVRVIDKSKLYADTAGAVTWYDFWDFRDPTNTTNALFGLRPTIMFGNPGVEFLVNQSPYSTGTFFTVWTVTNPLDNPACTGVDVPVVQYSSPPNPNQLGGGSLLIEAGGSDIRNEPVYRDSSIWAVQSIASGAGNQYSAVRYVKINPFQNKTVEDVAMGLAGYWHIYPSIMVDQDKNIIITFSRSNIFEYMGAYATGRRAIDPFGLAPSVTMREGLGNYVKDFGSGRNRWGDYSGIALDPAEPNTIWTHTEFVSATSTWGTWVAKMKMGPVSGPFLSLDRSSFSFGKLPLGSTSDTVSVTITNDGTDSLTIASISALSKHFKVTNLPTLPVNIQSLNSLTLRFLFAPQTSGSFQDSLLLNNNDPTKPSVVVRMTGSGYVLTNPVVGTMYATSDANDGGRLFTVNTSTGGTTLVGPTTANQITGMGVHPATKQLIGLDPNGSSLGTLYQLSTSGFYAKNIGSIGGFNLRGMAIKDDSTFYAGTISGTILKVKYPTCETTLVAVSGLLTGGLTLNPVTGELWLAARPILGAKDGIYKVDVAAGKVKLIGKTGFGVQTNALLFDKNGKLYGVTGQGTDPSNLILIDTSTAAGTLIGSMGIAGIQAIALSPDAPAGVGRSAPTALPSTYSLEQNFPNPFNPTTKIQFSLPTASKVTLKLFDALGREVVTLVDGIRQPGIYLVTLDGSRLASGVYYYRLTAGGFDDIKRMVLLK